MPPFVRACDSTRIERILGAAAQLFRERGFDGIGVADLMKEAGLTHGGFYGHFSSKDDLIAQASARELTRSLAHWSKVGERASGDRLSAIAAAYLTSAHRDNPGAGCVLAALGPDYWGFSSPHFVRPHPVARPWT